MFLVGICGGSGAGKTTLVNALLDRFHPNLDVISQDCYYYDRSNLSDDELSQTNFDQPDSIENELLVAHLLRLKEGMGVDVPRYCFRTHRRLEPFRFVEPKSIIIVEGILLFCDLKLREQFDLKMFVDCSDDLRLTRRIKRDVEQRDFTVQSVLNQYIRTVRLGHQQFVEPFKTAADIILRNHDLQTFVELAAALIGGIIDKTSVIE
jgi:uridine kinase